MSLYNQNVLKNWKIHQNWTLFLDRDGVINKRKIGDYIKLIDDFSYFNKIF